MKFTQSLKALLIFSYALASSACMAASSKLSSEEEAFVKFVVQAGTSEFETARLAIKRAEAKSVRDYAARVVKDRTSGIAEAKEIAAHAGFKVEAEGGAMHKIQLARMKKLTGNEFDQAFLKQMESDHTRALTMYQKEAKDGSNENLKALASRHVEEIKSLLEQSVTLKSQAERDPDARP